jgi:hypothetical protein
MDQRSNQNQKKMTTLTVQLATLKTPYLEKQPFPAQLQHDMTESQYQSYMEELSKVVYKRAPRLWIIVLSQILSMALLIVLLNMYFPKCSKTTKKCTFEIGFYLSFLPLLFFFLFLYLYLGLGLKRLRQGLEEKCQSFQYGHWFLQASGSNRIRINCNGSRKNPFAIVVQPRKREDRPAIVQYGQDLSTEQLVYQGHLI